jgi:hypothetical protein
MVRTAHGRARDLGRTVVIELPPPDELTDAIGEDRTDVVTADRGADGRFTAANRAGAVPKAALARVVTSEGDPTYRRFARAAGHWRRQRCDELSALSGGNLGSGPSAHVGAAARGMCDASYIRHLALLEQDPKACAGLLATANRIEAQWKSADLAAWELAQREGAARVKALDGNPFLVADESEAP